MTAFFLAAVLAAPAAAASRLYETELARVAQQGYKPEAAAEAAVSRGILRATVFRKGGGSQRLYVTLETAGQIKTLAMDLGGAQTLTLDAVHSEGTITDLGRDGGRVIAYHLGAPATGQETLVVMRWASNRLDKTARLPGGRFEDVDGDGKIEAVTRERPLGSLFTIACQSFHTMAQAAWRSDVYQWRNGALVKASESYKPYFDRRIAEGRAKVAAIDARSTEDYGGFLGLTLSLYFDYAASGRSRQGWGEFKKLYPVRASDPGPVKKCLTQMEAELRDRLDIPNGW